MHMTEQIKTDVDKVLMDGISFFTYTNSAQPMTIADSDTGRILDVNHAFSHLLGYSWSEAVGKTLSELDLFVDSTEVEKILLILKDCGHLEVYPIVVRSKCGQIRYGKVNAAVIEMYGRSLTLTIMEDETERIRYEEKISRLFEQAISCISKVGELRDSYTAGHQKRVERMACTIAAEMKLPQTVIKNVSTGAHLHDIGNIYIAPDILNKPSKLSEIEMKIIQSHPLLGYEVTKEIDLPPEIPMMVYQHHERLDGSGYPKGTKGADIILESRILAVADVVTAMSSHRPYRPALRPDIIVDEMKSNREVKYDPAVVDAYLRIADRNSGCRL